MLKLVKAGTCWSMINKTRHIDQTSLFGNHTSRRPLVGHSGPALNSGNPTDTKKLAAVTRGVAMACKVARTRICCWHKVAWMHISSSVLLAL